MCDDEEQLRVECVAIGLLAWHLIAGRFGSVHVRHERELERHVQQSVEYADEVGPEADLRR